MADQKAKAQPCILVWLKGGPSHVATWDPKPTSAFKPISRNVAGIQISELLPRVAKHLDKLAIIRSIHTEEIDPPDAWHYALTGHRVNPALAFPSVGSIIAKETGQRNNVAARVRLRSRKGHHTRHPKTRTQATRTTFLGGGGLCLKSKL